MKVAIIGGSGKMGQWFAHHLLQEGIEVVITGRNRQKLVAAGKKLDVPIVTNTDAARLADVVIISVPPDNFESIVKEIAPYLHQGQTIVYVTSIKTKPVEIMHRYIKTGMILGTHPVFGPGASNLSQQNVVLTPTNEAEAAFADKIRQYLEERGANVSIMTPQEHDRMMAVVLGLAHFIAIVSADTLLEFKNLPEMKKIGGTTFKVLYTLIASVISEDPELYASLQMSFPDNKKVESVFLSKTKIWTDMISSNDRRGFVRKMNALRKKLEKIDPSFQREYQNMYRITEKF